jgi:transglutaminase-like putative cysteine protease
LPIKGHVTGARRDDLVVEVVQAQDKNWFYSVPVDANGNFAVTITLPYQGQDYVNVGYPGTSDSFGLDNSATYGQFQNNQATLTTSQMAVLQSWMVNYNESAAIHTLAGQITAAATTKDQAIKDVSDWVSSHIYYNFPELTQGTFLWQQATQTMNVRYGVCQDQAAVAAALLRSLGIPTQVIDGEAVDPSQHQDIGGHAWNEAWDGTKWITFDSCWDQQYFQDTQVAAPLAVVDDYFNPSSASFSQTHVPDPNQPFAW